MVQKRSNITLPKDVIVKMKIIKMTLQEEIRERHKQKVRLTYPKIYRAIFDDFEKNKGNNYINGLLKKRGRKK